jgi:hypothetical protein
MTTSLVKRLQGGVILSASDFGKYAESVRGSKVLPHFLQIEPGRATAFAFSAKIPRGCNENRLLSGGKRM